MRTDASSCGFRYSESDKASAIRLYVAGVPCPEICADIGVSRTRLRCWIKASGVKLRRPGFPCSRPEITGAVARELWSKHGSARAAAEAIKMPASTFEKRAYGIHTVLTKETHA